MIDTHCHINFPDFNNDRDAVIKRARDAGVVGFITVATEPDNWRRSLDLAEGQTAVRVALGVHPNHAECYSAAALTELKELTKTHAASVVAIGETGLDFFRDGAAREKQFESFKAHLELAAELHKPFILHCRAAEAEMMEVLGAERTRIGGPLRGVWHCFTSTIEFAAQATELGLYFGLGGIVTYPKSGSIREAVATMPLGRILLETDCPFLPPQGWRGQRNEPAYLTKVVETIAEVRRSTPEEIRRVTTENARALFGAW